MVAMMGVLVLAGCGGGSHEGFLDGIDPTPNPDRTPGPNGDATVIEFVAPDDTASTTDTSTNPKFEASIGPAGSANAQSSLIQFRVLNVNGRPARNNLIVDFTIEGPSDARLTATEARTHDGFVQTFLIAGTQSGNAVVVARVRGTALVARSQVVAIARARGAAAAIEFFKLRVPDLLGNSDDNAGTPQTRTQLGVRGSGFNQAVDAVFVVLDANGAAALDGTVVDFTLFGPNGGESVSPASGVTADGFVATTILTGTRPGPVQIEARIRGTALVARAIPVTIGTALNPPASHLSLAADCLNVAGSVTFGLEDQIRAGVSDEFGNPLPLGSAVSFFTEGGGIQAQGVSEDGFSATANLITQLPIPTDRRINVLAVTTGQESFTDLNGNGTWDPGEPFVDIGPEPFLDANEDGIWEPGEFFIDQNNNGVFDATPNGVWDDQILISVQGAIVFSGQTVIDIEPQTFAIPSGGSQVFTLHVSDDIGSPLVGGTKIELSATNATVIPTEIVIPDTDIDTRGGFIPGATEFTVVLTAQQAEPQPSPAPGQEQGPTSASLTVSVEGPSSSGTGNERKCPGSNGNASITIVGTVGG
jgi:hypothetical protein